MSRVMHQNKYAFKHNPRSKKSEKIMQIPNFGLCQRCHDIIEWRKKFRKYKPLKQPGKCLNCSERKVTLAYHNWCSDCSKAADVCPKCLQNRELVQKQEAALTQESIQELLVQVGMKERVRRKVWRLWESGRATDAEIKHMILHSDPAADAADDDEEEEEDEGEEEEQKQAAAAAAARAAARGPPPRPKGLAPKPAAAEAASSAPAAAAPDSASAPASAAAAAAASSAAPAAKPAAPAADAEEGAEEDDDDGCDYLESDEDGEEDGEEEEEESEQERAERLRREALAAKRGPPPKPKASGQ